MANPNSYYLVGPIQNKTNVLFATTHNGYLYFLTKNGNNLIFDPRKPFSLLGAGDPVVANVNIANNSTTAFSILGNGNIVVDSNGFAMSSTNPAIPFTPVAMDLNTGKALVAGGNYTFNNAGIAVKFHAYTPVPDTNTSTTTPYAPNILLDENNQAVLQTFTGSIRVVPLVWYISNACSTIPPSEQDVIDNEAHWVTSAVNPNVTFLTGYTVQSDCNNGVFYQYCVMPNTCGSVNNCFGACPNTNDSCVLNTSNNTFSCKNTSSSSFQWWWILIIIGIVLLVVLIIAAIYYMSNRPTYVQTAPTRQVTFAPSDTYVQLSPPGEFSGETILI